MYLQNLGRGWLGGSTPVSTQVLLGQSQKDCGQRLDVGKAKERQKKERDQRGRDRVVGAWS